MRFNIILASVIVLMVLAGLIGAPEAHIHVALSGVGGTLVAVLVVFGALLPLPAYWHQKGNFERRDAVLVLYWTVLFKVLLIYQIALAARSQMPIRDSLLRSLDEWFGVSVPGLVAWAHSSPWLEKLSNITYFSLIPMLTLAILVPPLAGKRLVAQRFLLANVIGFAIGIPLFALFPVKGPWWGLHYGGTPLQAHAMQVRMAFRHERIFQLTPQTDLGIISFPSFHVFWAIISAWVLGQFRWLKWPTAVLALLICVSTMTTGYHYFADVLGGAVLAAVSLILVYIVLRPDAQPVEMIDAGSELADNAVFAAEATTLDTEEELVQPSGLDR